MLKGTYTAIATPFDDEDKINHKSLERLVEYQIKNNITGLVPCGTTGESPALTSREKKAVIEKVISISGKRCQVIAGTGSNNTQRTIEQSLWAKDAGADVAMVITPYYNKPGQKGLFAHFDAVASALSPFPLLIYNVPSRTNVNLKPATLKKLCDLHSNILGIKDASGNMEQVLLYKSAAPDNFSILCGEDGILPAYMACGAHGVVSVASNIYPKEIVNLVNNGLEGNSSVLLKDHLDLMNIMKYLFIETNPTPVKYALNIMGFEMGLPRLPLLELSEKYRDELRTLLTNYPKKSIA
ncbi:MAG TPA: 4-hydroxy-tetrahydrodipicolinate synthase [Saprospiraceae bacterium]|nr:4-hydroxy-tetrahydrodipicolinate synthase [Saprospiraceae bacterium]